MRFRQVIYVVVAVVMVLMAVFIGFLVGDKKTTTKTVTKVEKVRSTKASSNSTSSSSSSSNAPLSSDSSTSSTPITSSSANNNSSSNSASNDDKSASSEKKPYQDVVYSFHKTNSAGTVDVDYSIILRSDGTATQQLINRAETSPNVQSELDKYAVNSDGKVRFLRGIGQVNAEYAAPGDILNLPPKDVSWTGKGSDMPNQTSVTSTNAYQLWFKGDDYSKMMTNEVGLYATQSGAPEPQDTIKLGQQLQDQYTQNESGN